MPTDNSYMDLMHYIALLAVRVPKVWDFITKQFEDNQLKINRMITRTKSTKEIMEMLNQNGVTVGSLEEAEEIKNEIINGDYSINVDNTYKVKILMHLIEPLPPLLSYRTWRIIYKTDNQLNNFITSDCPIMLYPSNSDSKYFSPGFGLEGTEVYFPISKDVAMLGDFTEPKNAITSRRTKNYIIKRCNDNTITMANRFIFSYLDTIGSNRYSDEINSYAI